MDHVERELPHGGRMTPSALVGRHRGSGQVASIDSRAQTSAELPGHRARVELARLVVAVAGLLAGCLNERSPTAADGQPARLALTARLERSTAGAIDGSLRVRLTYARGSLPAGELSSTLVPLPNGGPSGTTVSQPLEIDLGPCLSDPEHVPAGGSCSVTVSVMLLVNASQRDEIAIGPIPMRPGQVTTLDDVTLFEAGSIQVIVPTAPRLFPLGTLALSGRVLDGRGGAVAAPVIAWSSMAAGIATVDAATGVVTGVAPGVATMRATSGGRTAEGSVRVFARPVIAVAAATTLVAERGATTLPDALSLAVTNGAEGELAGLAVGAVAFEPALTPGWLSATLSAATAPATLVLRPTRTDLPAGSYVAIVPLTAADAAGPASLRVTYAVRDPALLVVPSALAFEAAGTLPAARTVAVTSTGGSAGPITTAVGYGPGASGWLDVSVAGGGSTPTTLAVRPNTPALASGSYTATLTVSAPNASGPPRLVTVTYVVAPRVLAVSHGTLGFSATFGDAKLPPAQSLSVGSTGGSVGPVTTSIDYVGAPPSGAPVPPWLTAVVTGSTNTPTTVSVRPSATRLPSGTYVADVVITAPGATGTRTVRVTYDLRDVVLESVLRSVAPPAPVVPPAPPSSHREQP